MSRYSPRSSSSRLHFCFPPSLGKCVASQAVSLQGVVPQGGVAAIPWSTKSSRERKLNTNFFFSNFSGAPGISRQNPRISRLKSLISLVSRDVSNFLALAPARSRGRHLPHWKISGPKSLGLGSFSVPDHHVPEAPGGQNFSRPVPDHFPSCICFEGSTTDLKPLLGFNRTRIVQKIVMTERWMSATSSQNLW